MKKKFNKLVRDKIPNELIKNNKAFKAHGGATLTDYSSKIVEEAMEVRDAIIEYAAHGVVCAAYLGDQPPVYYHGNNSPNDKKEIIDEIGDLLEVVFASMERLNISPKEVKAAMSKKAAKCGKFKDGIILEWVMEE